MSFSVTSETAEVSQLMEKLRDTADNNDDLLERVGNTLQDRSRLRFDTGGEGEWEPLAKKTKETKERKGLSPEILIATGALKSSYTVKGANGAIFEISNGKLKYGSSLEYASRHQFGNFNVPKRQVIVYDQDLELDIIADALEDFDF